jgi:proteasome lid subunit RPN8/RPN11
MTTPRRAVPYPGIGSRFYLPRILWENTLDAIRKYGQRDSEGLVYWGGVIGAAGETLVTSLILLNHIPQGGRVQPTADEMRALLRALRARDEKLVAQIHSHEGQAFHSLGDSQRATSYHPGYVSIVIPWFGQGVRELSDCAVYEFRGEFEALSREEIAGRFIVHDQVVALMPWQEAVRKETAWNVLSRKLKSIVRRKL